MSVPGSPYEQLWRDVYVATIKGLSANPQFSNKGFEEIADWAARQADAAMDEFNKRVRARS